MKKKIGVIGFVLVCLLLVGILAKNRLMETSFEALKQSDQNMLRQIAKIYKESEREKQSKEKVSLVITSVNEDREPASKISYMVGKPRMIYSFFSKSVKAPKELDLPGVYQISTVSKSILWTWFTAHFTFVDVGTDYTFFYKIG